MMRNRSASGGRESGYSWLEARLDSEGILSGTILSCSSSALENPDTSLKTEALKI